MTEAIDWKRLEGALSLGLSRQPLPPLASAEGLDEQARALAALALLGQRTRLAPAGGPHGEIVGSRLPDDPRPMLDPAAREALLRLDRRLDAESRRRLAPLVLRAVAASGRRLHLFDLPDLDALLRAGGKALSPVERAWLGWTASGSGAAPNPQGGPADRLEAFRQARRDDPAGARATLAAGLSAETAKLRGELVASLDIGLGPDDAPLLEACLADRAQGVREAATALLARLPGSPAYQDRLARARACLGIETKGLLRKTRRLSFKPPPGDRQAAASLFAGFRLADLIAELGLATTDLPEAAAGAQSALPLLANAALLDDDPALAAALLTRIDPPAWPGDLLDLPSADDRLSPQARQALLAASLTPNARFDPRRDGFRLGEFLDGALADDLAGRLIASPPWRRWLVELAQQAAANDKFEVDLALLPAACAMPPALAQAAAETLAVIPPARQPKTAAYLAFLARLAAPPNPSAPSETPVV
jgi:hypothetical protein